jgi:hypothetical protein
MHTRTTTAAVLLTAGLTITACSPTSSGSRDTTPTTPPTTAGQAPIPDTALAKGARTAACWRAIRAQYQPGTVQLTGAPTEPPECAGLSTDEVSAVAEDVLAHQLG